MNFDITTAGQAAITSANNAGPKVNVSAFKLGSAVAYSPVVGDTGLHGTILHTGVVSSVNIIDATTVDYQLQVDATVGNFDFGEIGLFLSDGTLFALAALTQLQYKSSTTSSSVGNNITISAKLSMTNAYAIVNYSIPT